MWEMERSRSRSPFSSLGKRGWFPGKVSVELHTVLRVLTLRVHGNRPVNEIQVDIGSLQQIQTLLETLLSACVECAPELAGDEQILALHDATGDDILDSIADLVLILVAKGAVNVPVTTLNGVDNSFLHLTRCRLPRSQAKSGDCSSGVERNCGIHFGLWIQNGIRSGFENELGKGGIHGGTGYMYLLCMVGCSMGGPLLGSPAPKRSGVATGDVSL